MLFWPSASPFRDNRGLLVSEPCDEILHDPASSTGLKPIGGGAMFPYSEANGFDRVGLQLGLGEETRKVTRQNIAASALGEMGIAG